MLVVELLERMGGVAEASALIQVVTPHARRHEIRHLPIGRLRTGRHPRISNEFRHERSGCLISDLEYPDSITRLRHIVTRIAGDRNSPASRSAR